MSGSGGGALNLRSGVRWVLVFVGRREKGRNGTENQRKRGGKKKLAVWHLSWGAASPALSQALTTRSPGTSGARAEGTEGTDSAVVTAFPALAGGGGAPGQPSLLLGGGASDGGRKKP